MVDSGPGKKVSGDDGVATSGDSVSSGDDAAVAGGGEQATAPPPRSGPDFSQIVGQDALKEALLLIALHDDIDGLLVRGEKGTAKSTAVRALPDLLPDLSVVADCPYGCHPSDPTLQCSDCRDRADPPVEREPVPLVTLPLGATRDRVLGTLSIAEALDGDYEFEPGLLARAHRGILYVDEVNLLPDHLVDVLLDAVASGVNRVERDGVTVTHPADVTLVGTMNPEEGDLRPQLRDRFDLQTEVTACEDLADRVAIIDQAIAPAEPTEGPAEADGPHPGRRLRRALSLLDEVDLPPADAREIALLCREAGVDGHRADIAIARAAMGLAALDGRTSVRDADLETAAGYALPHRMQSQPFEDAPDADSVIEEHFDDGEAGEGDPGHAGNDQGGDADAPTDDDGAGGGAEPEGSGDETQDADPAAGGDQGPDGSEGDTGGMSAAETGASTSAGPDGGAPESASGPAEAVDGGDGATPAPQPRSGSGEAGEDASGTDGGESAGAVRSGAGDDAENPPRMPGQTPADVGAAEAPPMDLSVDADTSRDGGDASDRGRASASEGTTGPRVRTREATGEEPIDGPASVRAAASRGASSLGERDLRESVRVGEQSALVCFVVDASASMRPAMRAAKGTLFELLRDSYEHRDEVTFVAFAGDGAEVVLPPTDSVTLAARHLKRLPTGDRTPLPAGLQTAAAVLERADPAASAVVLVSDGGANVADGSPTEATAAAARRLARQDPAVLVVDASEDDRSDLLGSVCEVTGAERIPLDRLSAARVDETVGTDDSSPD
jgi:magnesium chelatase subunit D